MGDATRICLALFIVAFAPMSAERARAETPAPVHRPPFIYPVYRYTVYPSYHGVRRKPRKPQPLQHAQ